jgi:hypothetical protein
MGPNASQQGNDHGANDASPADISGWGNIAGYRDNRIREKLSNPWQGLACFPS